MLLTLATLLSTSRQAQATISRICSTAVFRLRMQHILQTMLKRSSLTKSTKCRMVVHILITLFLLVVGIQTGHPELPLLQSTMEETIISTHQIQHSEVLKTARSTLLFQQVQHKAMQVPTMVATMVLTMV